MSTRNKAVYVWVSVKSFGRISIHGDLTKHTEPTKYFTDSEIQDLLSKYPKWVQGNGYVPGQITYRIDPRPVSG